MYHSVIFGEKNTYDDWKLVPTQRPVIVPPQQKTTYIDIPGADGSLDVSDTLTGYPIFNDREGSLSFYVLNSYDDDVSYYNFANKYSEIMTYLHGSRLHMILEDDPEWYYDGRFWVENWTPDNHHSQLSVKYKVDPYKWSINSSADPNWLWDPFNFETDVILSALFTNIEVTSDTEWTTRSYTSLAIGQSPVCPIFEVASQAGHGMEFYVRNITKGTYLETHLDDGVSTKHNVMIFGGDIVCGFKGKGVISLIFRRGRL